LPVVSDKKLKSVSEPHTPPRGEIVYNKLRQAILDGEYLPGQPVRETEVAARLGVSRTPVREAFRRLQTDGILEFAPWRGVTVAELDEKQIIELYAMRKVLEGTAASLAALNATGSQVDELETIMERAEGETDADVLADLNRDFHQAIFDAADNRYLLHALRALRNPMALLSKTTYSVPDRPVTAQSEHRQIVEAIKLGDTGGAEKLGYGHIANAEQARFKLLSED
jgi:DNA-binding GntR family transcriptional regulator